MRNNSYLIRSQSALGHQRWGIEFMGHNLGTAGTEIPLSRRQTTSCGRGARARSNGDGTSWAHRVVDLASEIARWAARDGGLAYLYARPPRGASEHSR